MCRKRPRCRLGLIDSAWVVIVTGQKNAEKKEYSDIKSTMGTIYPQSADNCQDVNIMVNVFGDRGASSDNKPGPRGPRGVKGDHRKSGIDDMCRWIPDLTLEQFQRNETCCFLLTNPAKDLIKTAGGAYVTWISRSGSKTNAILNPSKKVLRISNAHNALVFIKSL